MSVASPHPYPWQGVMYNENLGPIVQQASHEWHYDHEDAARHGGLNIGWGHEQFGYTPSIQDVMVVVNPTTQPT